MSLTEAENITCKFNYRHLHPETNAKKRQIIFAGIFYSCNLTFYAPMSKSRCNQQTIQAPKFLSYIIFGNEFTMHIQHMYFALIERSSMDKRLEYRFIGVLELNVFADESDCNFAFWIFQFF